jgi:hypothetical protein
MSELSIESMDYDELDINDNSNGSGSNSSSSEKTNSFSSSSDMESREVVDEFSEFRIADVEWLISEKLTVHDKN